jgi:hypothetical protein
MASKPAKKMAGKPTKKRWRVSEESGREKTGQ